jgi:hypothetical protein
MLRPRTLTLTSSEARTWIAPLRACTRGKAHPGRRSEKCGIWTRHAPARGSSEARFLDRLLDAVTDGIKRVVPVAVLFKVSPGLTPIRAWEPLLYEPWVLDIDTTIKTNYGRQEGAEVGYNPTSRDGRAIRIIPTGLGACGSVWMWRCARARSTPANTACLVYGT